MAQVTLEVKARYRNRQLGYEAGQTITVDEELALFLRTDSPGTFVVVADEEPVVEEPEPVKKKAPRKPARNKAVQQAPLMKTD